MSAEQEIPGMLLHLRQPFAPDRQVEGSWSPSLGWMSRSAASQGLAVCTFTCLRLRFMLPLPLPDGSPAHPPHLRSASGEPLEIAGNLESQNLPNPRPC